MVQVAVLPPDTVRTVISAVPGLRARIFPLLSTSATAGLLLLHVTALLWVVLLGSTVAVRWKLSPGSSVSELRFRRTPVTGMTVGVGGSTCFAHGIALPV